VATKGTWNFERFEHGQEQSFIFVIKGASGGGSRFAVGEELHCPGTTNSSVKIAKGTLRVARAPVEGRRRATRS